MIAGISTAFVQVKHGGGSSGARSPSSAAASAAWPTADIRGWNIRDTGAVGDCWRRPPRTDETLRMVAQQQETQLPEFAAKLAAGSADGTCVAKPFVSRKLGSFEKMLTQTRDGVGPAEDGIRTLLTPHVWVSTWVPQTLLLLPFARVRRKESVRLAACMFLAEE